MKTVSAPLGINAPVKMRAALCASFNARADRQDGFAVSQFAVANGVSVNGGIGERRQRNRRKKVLRENTSVGRGNGHRLVPPKGGHTRNDHGDCVFDRHQLAAERKTIVAELRHRLLAPLRQ
jgi:hypothetical protein